MKTYLKFVVALTFATVVGLLVYSCMKESPKVSIEDEPFFTEMAGNIHNKCLDTFYAKLALLKDKTRSEDLPPVDVGDEEQKFEDLVVASVVESLKEMDMGEDTEKELRDIIEYCDNNKGVEITVEDLSEQAVNYVEQVNDIINNYSDALIVVSKIEELVKEAKSNLSDNEYIRFSIMTSIAKSSVCYWDENCSTWFPVDETRGVRWRNVARADVNAAVDAALRSSASGGIGFFSWIVSACRFATWPVYLIAIGATAAVASIVDAIEQAIEEVDIDGGIINNVGSDFCVNVTERALREYIDASQAEDDGDDSEVESD